MPNTGSGTPLGQSSHSGTRLTGAWADDAGADPGAADAPVAIPPAVRDGAAAAPALGIVLMLPDEALPGTTDCERGVVKLGDIDPTAPVLVVVGENAAPYGVTVVAAEVAAAAPTDVVVPAGLLVMLPVLVPVCPVIWAAAGAASPTTSSNARLNECATAIPQRGWMTTVRTAISASSSAAIGCAPHRSWSAARRSTPPNNTQSSDP